MSRARRSCKTRGSAVRKLECMVGSTVSKTGCCATSASRSTTQKISHAKAQRRREIPLRNAAALCTFAPLREKSFPSLTSGFEDQDACGHRHVKTFSHPFHRDTHSLIREL